MLVFLAIFGSDFDERICNAVVEKYLAVSSRSKNFTGLINVSRN